jgi:hypothetical protein
MEQITKSDLLLINALSQNTYSNNKLLSKATESEKEQLDNIKRKLKEICIYFSKKYKDSYGPFETSVVTGNDIAIGGTRFKRIWSGLFKGAENKQYAAQISFVLNPVEACLDVGFYFGRAQTHSKNKEERKRLETQLKSLGISLSNSIKNNELFNQKYLDLFDFGFSAYSNGENVTSENWFELIVNNTKSSQIIAKVYPNDFDIIENSTIDLYVSQIIFLMGGISNKNEILIPNIKPLTPEQRAKQAERLAQIGLEGERFIFISEQNKLAKFGIIRDGYPRHVALESENYGYDILSLDANEDDIYIEVKTTTRIKNDTRSRFFYISNNEINTFLENKNRYKLYIVYNVENKPEYEELDLNELNKRPDGYIVEY